MTPLKEFKKGIRSDPITRAAWLVAILLFMAVVGGIAYGLTCLLLWVL